jgi:putative NIF3 family GTP cyclohydrolase 1 type 2
MKAADLYNRLEKDFVLPDSGRVLTKILDSKTTDAMLFVHHPLVWELSENSDKAFHPINAKLLRELKARRVSIFNFHLPLDNFGEYAQVVGHDVGLYQYGDSLIKDSKVSLCAGGGNDLDIVKEMAEEGVNVHITGISVNNPFSAESHKFEREHGINLLGGTHYSTEKFACMAMCNYFGKLGLKSEFIGDAPCLLDL